MNGSLKSLSKALNNVFDKWDDEGSDEEFNSELSDLYKIIELMKEKRNTLHIIKNSSSVNDELIRQYNKNIKPSSNLKKEITFLTILTKLYSILKEEEIDIWMEAYLKPAVDSAGYDHEFVNKARDLIKEIGNFFIESKDTSLIESKERVSLKLMDWIIQIFLGNKRSRYKLINIELSEEELKKQTTHERLRLIKRNCKELLFEFGLKKNKIYFELLDKYFLIPSDRLGILTLISNFVSIPITKINAISDTSLFENLLKSLFYDYSDSCILSTTYILSMIIPNVYYKLRPYVSDLFLIYFRLTCWLELDQSIDSRTDLISSTLYENNNWDCLKPEPSSSISGNKLDCSHFATLLYALFPKNFIKFCQQPYEYLQEYPNKLFDIKKFNKINMLLNSREINSIKLENILKEKSNTLFRSFLLHPNLMIHNVISLEHELKSPLNWIEENYLNSSEDIILECLRLNPNLIITIPKNVTENDIAIWEKTGKQFSPYNRLKPEFKSNKYGYLKSYNDSRNSSAENSMFMDEKIGPFEKFSSHRACNEINKRLSLTSANLAIDNPRKPNVLFKDVNFSKAKSCNVSSKDSRSDDDTKSNDLDPQGKTSWGLGSNPTSPLLRVSSGSNIDPLTDLFNTHEKLYAPKPDDSYDTAIDNGGKRSYYFNNEKNKGELLMQNPMSSPTISLETTTVHKGSISGSSLSNPTANLKDNDISGTVIDFYQRELLLLKNELEFSSYMKYLNKYNYILLKLQMNKMLKEDNAYCHSAIYQNNMLKLKNLQIDYADLMKSIEKLRIEQEDLIATKEIDINNLKKLLITFQNENNELKQKLRSAIDENVLLEKENRNKNDNINTNYEVMIDEEIEPIREIAISNPREDINSSKFIASGTSIDEYEQKLAERDEHIFSISEELALLKEENFKLLNKTDNHNSSNLSIKSENSELNNFRTEINESIHTLTVQYERKIKELNAVIIKYENLLEEKNSRIMHLTTTKPISIPGANGSLTMNCASDEDNERSTTSTSPSLPSWNKPLLQLQTPNSHIIRPTQGSNSKISSSSSIPIIKGRGGYQKRTKARK